MSERLPAARPALRGLTVAVDVVLFTARGTELAVLLASVSDPRRRTRGRWTLPSAILRADESPDAAAARAAHAALAIDPSFLEQAGAQGIPRASAGRVHMIIAYFGLVPAADASVRDGSTWTSVNDLPALDQRFRDGVAGALSAMRARVDDQPIAFRLLPPAFTLSELQVIYELLLGRRLHKASFRRSLHAAALVEATDEWRSEGRGRPAQLFRYAPKRRRRPRRGVRFDLLG